MVAEIFAIEIFFSNIWKKIFIFSHSEADIFGSNTRNKFWFADSRSQWTGLSFYVKKYKLIFFRIFEKKSRLTPCLKKVNLKKISPNPWNYTIKERSALFIAENQYIVFTIQLFFQHSDVNIFRSKSRNKFWFTDTSCKWTGLSPYVKKYKLIFFVFSRKNQG